VIDELRNRGLGRAFATAMAWLLFAFVSLQMGLHVLTGLALIDGARIGGLSTEQIAAVEHDTTELVRWVLLGGFLGVILLIGWISRFRRDREALLGAPPNLYLVVPDLTTAPELPVSARVLWIVLGVVFVSGFLVRGLPSETLEQMSLAWLVTALFHFVRAAIGVAIAAMVILTQLRLERALKSTFGNWASAI
jgi:hypothetical protein